MDELTKLQIDVELLKKENEVLYRNFEELLDILDAVMASLDKGSIRVENYVRIQ